MRLPGLSGCLDLPLRVHEHASSFEAAVSPQGFIKIVAVREVPEEGRGPGRPQRSQRALGAGHPRQAQRNEALPYPVGGGAAPLHPSLLSRGSQGPTQRGKK